MTAQIKLEKVDLVITDTLAFQILVHSIVLKFEKIWSSHTLNIIRKPKKSLFSKEKGPYLMHDKGEIHRNQIQPIFYAMQIK